MNEFRKWALRTGAGIASAWLATVGTLAQATVLKDVCGPQAGAQYGSTNQLGQLCQSAYINGNLWIINDNDARVRGSIAVVCAYSCLSGGMTSCSSPDGGGNPCQSAVNSGWKAYDYDNSSSNNYHAAQTNGYSALTYQQGNPAAFANTAATGNPGAPNSAGATAAAPLSASCQAATGGGISDRIACAAETDPSLPAFAQSPQFAQDFQKITGTSLQTAFTESGDTLLNGYSMQALQNAYNAMGGNKMSFTDFVSKGIGLLSNMVSGMSPEDKAKFLASVVPPGMRGLIPVGAPGSKTTAVASKSGDAAAGVAPADASRATPDRTAAAALGRSSFADADAGRDPASSDFGKDPEYNPRVSLFARVSRQYQLSDLFTGRISIPDWTPATPNRQ